MRAFRLYLYFLFTLILPETRFFRFKIFFLRWCGVVIGNNVRICSSVKFSGVGNVLIGNDVWIGAGTIISASGESKIIFGDCIDIASQVLISTGSHRIDEFGLHSAGEGTNKSIYVKNGVWLGERSILLPGVVIGEKAIVGAGAIVTKDVVSRSIVVGSPARILRKF